MGSRANEYPSMPAFKDLSGNQYGFLTVLKFHSTKKFATSQTSLWECRCECGSIKITAASALKSGRTVSCGCQKVEQARKHWDKRGRKHCLSDHPLYQRWLNMNNRCHKPTNTSYKWYGAKGITVCQEWRESPQNYIDYVLSLGWVEGLSIDRIDGAKGYCPENTRLATAKIQANNVSRNHVLDWSGQQKTLSEWADHVGIPYATLQTRIYRGWSIERALATSSNPRGIGLRLINQAKSGATKPADKVP